MHTFALVEGLKQVSSSIEVDQVAPKSRSKGGFVNINPTITRQLCYVYSFYIHSASGFVGECCYFSKEYKLLKFPPGNNCFINYFPFNLKMQENQSLFYRRKI